MPIPMIGLNAVLRQHLLRYRQLFTLPQWPYLVTVLLGMVQCEGRQTMTAWLRVARTGITLWGLSPFLTHAPWDEEAMGRQWFQDFRGHAQVVIEAACDQQRATRPKRRGRPKTPVVTGYLIFDDSVQHKPRGKRMRGLGKHDSTTAERVVSGHNLVQGLYVVQERRCPLTPQRYRTKTTCERDGVAFHSKIDLVRQQVETFVPLPQTLTCILVDSWYLAKSIWKTARRRGFAMAGGAKKNRQLRRLLADGTRIWQRFDDYAATLTPEAFQLVTWPSATNAQTLAVHAVRTRVHGLGACQVIVVRPTPDAGLDKTRFFVTSLVDDSLEQVVATLALRWQIEVFFEDLKEVLDIDHYQVMHDRAIRRIWILACCLYTCLEEHQAAVLDLTGQRLSIGLVRRAFQDDHHLNTLTWLQQRFAQGDAPETLLRLLAG